MNIQFIVAGGGTYRGFNGDHHRDDFGDAEVYIIEVNPRSSRTIPFISKVTRIPMVRIATEVMQGRNIKEQGYTTGIAKKQN